eukprot:scaffold1964_cov252-Isochrysis_galbana.AAC.8
MPVKLPPVVPFRPAMHTGCTTSATTSAFWLYSGVRQRLQLHSSHAAHACSPTQYPPCKMGSRGRGPELALGKPQL